jgi:transposase
MSIMGRDLSLAPCGLFIESAEPETGVLVILARPSSGTADCPLCGSASTRIHSTYQRSLADLPSHGRLVRIKLSTRWFRCVLATCSRRIFTERLAATAGRPFARRTARLEGIRASPRAGPGRSAWAEFRAASAVTRQQGHVAARRTTTFGVTGNAAPRVIGIDDWAFKRGHRYGTIVCDLEQRRIIDLLPDREAATVTAWLAARPSIGVIERDRGVGLYPGRH